MPDDVTLEPAEALAARNPIRQLGESEEYRAARQRLLAREYELRRHIESVAAERHALPIWLVLDMSPAGRRPNWYPSLNWAGRH